MAQAHHQINTYNQQLQAYVATRESFASSVAVMISGVAPSSNENRLYARMSREENAEGGHLLPPPVHTQKTKPVCRFSANNDC